MDLRNVLLLAFITILLGLISPNIATPWKSSLWSTGVQRRRFTVETFSVKTCNKTAPLQGTISVSPDPIKIPGNVTVEFKGAVGVTVKSPTKAVLKVEKKVFDVFVEVPCVDNLGSCTYDDGCAMIPLQPGDDCPPPLSTYNLPCMCPFAKGVYSLPKTTVMIPDEHLPSFLTDGDYKVNVKLYDTQNNQLACVDAAFSLTN